MGHDERSARKHGSGKWDAARDVPKSGWTHIGTHDNGADYAVCEMCECKNIRYVHQMQHADYPDTLGCGCICAAAMQGGDIAKREDELNAITKALINANTRKAKRAKDTRADRHQLERSGSHAILDWMASKVERRLAAIAADGYECEDTQQLAEDIQAAKLFWAELDEAIRRADAERADAIRRADAERADAKRTESKRADLERIKAVYADIKRPKPKM